MGSWAQNSIAVNFGGYFQLKHIVRQEAFSIIATMTELWRI